TLKIMNDNGVITAQFEAQNQRVKEIIEANFNQLKQSLQDQGINISSLSVNVSSGESNNSSDNESNGNNTNSQAGGIEGDLSDLGTQETIIEESVALGSQNSYRA
ncbi:MAG: flagellar hook-length control protein FliK, partial [Coprobacillaceae bacterium]